MGAKLDLKGEKRQLTDWWNTAFAVNVRHDGLVSACDVFEKRRIIMR